MMLLMIAAEFDGDRGIGDFLVPGVVRREELLAQEGHCYAIFQALDRKECFHSTSDWLPPSPATGVQARSTGKICCDLARCTCVC